MWSPGPLSRSSHHWYSYGRRACAYSAPGWDYALGESHLGQASSDTLMCWSYTRCDPTCCKL